MPHSGGGGSHGGGSHGGSHGGRSSRTSHSYFPGARRYRRHYNDGRPDEYIYSSGRPQKTTLASIITMILFGGIFSSMMFFSIRADSPKRLEENYVRPDSYVVDNIDILDKEDEIDELLGNFNDNTGICPVIYTLYTEDYEDDYVDLESFAYNVYIETWEDERHYLIVFAVPEDQAAEYRKGKLEVPDYEYEIMMGDDTDPVITESIERSVVADLREGFESGEDPDLVFIDVFESLIEKTDARLNSGRISLMMFLPIVIVLLIFGIPVIAMIKAYNKDKHVEIEEVPLTESDNEYLGKYRENYRGFSGNSQMPVEFKGNIGIVVKVLMMVFMLPFIIVGLVQIIGGASDMMSGDNVSGVFRLIFGIIWSLILVITMGTIFSRLGKSSKSSGTPMTADYPDADYPHAEYPQSDYPSTDYEPVSHDNCHSSHEEDEDSIRKGYE